MERQTSTNKSNGPRQVITITNTNTSRTSLSMAFSGCAADQCVRSAPSQKPRPEAATAATTFFLTAATAATTLIMNRAPQLRRNVCAATAASLAVAMVAPQLRVLTAQRVRPPLRSISSFRRARTQRRRLCPLARVHPTDAATSLQTRRATQRRAVQASSCPKLF